MASDALHPRLLVTMRLVDLCHFTAEYDDYHLARISELSKLLLALGPNTVTIGQVTDPRIAPIES